MNFGEIKKIYDNLRDEASKMIFEKRLAFSLSGDFKNIDDMVVSEMERYGSADIVNRCIEWIKDKKIKAISVFGAGFAGYQIVHALMLNGISVCKMYDNNAKRWGTKCHDALICSPKEIESDEYIILGVNYFRDEILKQLESLGVDRNHIFIPDGLWWLGNHPQYFDKGIMKPSEHEIFVDGGSLDGMDSKNFASWCEGYYDYIYAFEPDSANIDKMKAVANEINRFEVCPVGLWSEKTVLRFTSGASENCTISEEGDISIDVDSIDNVLNGRSATYIKMDIEGSELRAIEGAEKTIKTYRPKLAICVYHKPEDIIDIPMKIMKINPNYNFYLRHYSYVETETVLYAVNEEVN